MFRVVVSHALTSGQHIAVITAIAIYASGASKHASDPSNDNANAEWRTGIILLLMLWIVLCLAFAVLARKVPLSSSRALFWLILIALVLIGIRVIYQCVATFNKNQGSFNPVTGSIALRVIFQFLPGAFTLLALVGGGVMSIEEVAVACVLTRNDVEMPSRNVGSDGRVGNKS